MVIFVEPAYILACDGSAAHRIHVTKIMLGPNFYQSKRGSRDSFVTDLALLQGNHIPTDLGAGVIQAILDSLLRLRFSPVAKWRDSLPIYYFRIGKPIPYFLASKVGQSHMLSKTLASLHEHRFGADHFHSLRYRQEEWCRT